MQRQQRQLLRLAQAIYRANAAPDKPAPLALPEEAWRNCQTLLRRRAQAHSRGWQAAAAQVQRGLKVSVRNLAEELTVCAAVLEPPPATPFASPREIYHDLLALQDEFIDFAWDRQEHTLSVTTPAITLEGVPLGRFAITLRWPSLRPVRYGGYRITALDPHPAEKDEDVTHPHVQGEMLCEGDAHAAIQKALSQGRLLDFFLIVRSVLETYNSDSPYVALEEWEEEYLACVTREEPLRPSGDRRGRRLSVAEQERQEDIAWDSWWELEAESWRDADEAYWREEATPYE